ncbi:MAG: sulfite reductase subunit beta (hemoprotein) [Desulfobulbaceae bacterium]|nr:sulfite reductase subunit beta (hemoprotein) [Desulfobulbaceae bacterium]
MNFYEIPNTFGEEIVTFERSIDQFNEGQLHPTKFRAIRVPFGVYEQRTKGTFMLRIRSTAGGITPRQLQKVSELAERFGKPIVHVTTRQEVQLHDARLDDIPELIRELYSVGLSSRGGGGNTVRNIMASYDSGINPEEIFDVTPHAVALSSRLIDEQDSWSFARKFKISFSSTKADNALAAFNDLGFIAATQNGERGFKVYVAGGMGCRPRLSKVLHEFIEETQVYSVCSAVKNLYLEFGNRKTKNSGRLRFLWEELGETRFREIYLRELKKVEESDPLELDLTSYENQSDMGRIVGLSPKNLQGDDFNGWKKQYVTDQLQAGLKSILVPLPLGDLQAQDGIKLSRFLAKFGENVMRMTMTQNIQVRNLPEEYLGNLYELVNEIATLSHFPKFCGDIIACTGANTCTTGVCLPQGVVPVLQKYILKSGLNPDAFGDLRINISGCPNSCGQHHVGDIGLYGRIARKNGKSLPGYWVTGGASIDPDTRAYTEKCGWVAARDLPRLVVNILSHYASHGGQGEVSFAEYFKNEGQKEIATLCSQYNEKNPDFATDESYYSDWGANEEFTTAHMGHGECSAGIYDMIEVSMNSIKENLEVNAEEEGEDKRGNIAWDLVSASAGMLLVTRGIDPTTEFEILQQFENHFIDRHLVDEKFRPLLKAAIEKDIPLLSENLQLAEELGRTMIQLYHSMDNRLKFKCEADEICTPAPDMSQTKGDDELFKDLRGVVCPMNFVKTKVELSKINIGDRLRILLDDGEPIDNVPRSVKTEGHEILSQEQDGDHWVVVIEKNG